MFFNGRMFFRRNLFYFPATWIGSQPFVSRFGSGDRWVGICAFSHSLQQKDRQFSPREALIGIEDLSFTFA